VRLLAVALVALVVVPAAAAGRVLVFTAAAGDVLHGSLPVPGATRLYAADATTGNTTGIVYLTRRTPVGAGRWIAIGTPETGAPVPFTVHVPRHARPGQYFAGIVAVGSKRRVARVEVDVAGPRLARFVLGAVHVGRATLYLHVSNTGNVARRPQGTVSIQTRAGARLRRLRFRMASFLPHTSVDYPLRLERRLAHGTYVAVVRLTYPDAAGTGAATSSAAPQFTVSKLSHGFRPHAPTTAAPSAPAHHGSWWPWLAAGAGALVVAAGAVALRRRRPVTVTVRPVLPLSPEAARCEGFHYWEVDWDHPERRPGGTVTYPHRCRRCGLEVHASDIGDAAAKAASLS
jgi:hypothetical protein